MFRGVCADVEIVAAIMARPRTEGLIALNYYEAVDVPLFVWQ
jgi:hypothetical protein